MQRGSLAMVIRKEGPAVWQFRWSEKGLCGARVQRKSVIGSIDRYPNETAARSAVTVLLAEINSEKARIHTRSITVAQLCDHIVACYFANFLRVCLGPANHSFKATRHGIFVSALSEMDRGRSNNATSQGTARRQRLADVAWCRL
jgi:hypothetical protein